MSLEKKLWPKISITLPKNDKFSMLSPGISHDSKHSGFPSYSDHDVHNKCLCIYTVVRHAVIECFMLYRLLSNGDSRCTEGDFPSKSQAFPRSVHYYVTFFFILFSALAISRHKGL